MVAMLIQNIYMNTDLVCVIVLIARTIALTPYRCIIICVMNIQSNCRIHLFAYQMVRRIPDDKLQLHILMATIV